MRFGRVGNNWNVANIEDVQESMIPMPVASDIGHDRVGYC